MDYTRAKCKRSRGLPEDVWMNQISIENQPSRSYYDDTVNQILVAHNSHFDDAESNKAHAEITPMNLFRLGIAPGSASAYTLPTKYELDIRDGNLPIISPSRAATCPSSTARLANARTYM